MIDMAITAEMRYCWIAQRISKTIRLYDAVGVTAGRIPPGASRCSGYEAMQIANRVLESV